MYSLTTVLGSVFEMYISHMFLSKFGKIKHNKSSYYAFCVFITILSILASFTLVKSGLIIFAYFILLISQSIFFNIKFSQKLLICFCVIITGALSEMISAMVITIGLNIDINALQDNDYTYSICIVASKFLEYSILKPIKDRTHKPIICFPVWFKIGSSILPFSSFFIIILLYRYSILVDDTKYQISTLIAAAFLIASNLLILFIIDRQENYYITKERLLFAELHIKNQINHYADLYAQQEKLKKFRHDNKNIYTSLISILETRSPNEAIELIKEKMSIFFDTNETINSGNPVIDAIIYSKKELCINKGIIIECSIKTSTKIYVDELELGVLIGSALDNAIDATSQIKDSCNKTIYLSIITLGDMISIEISNPTNVNLDVKNLRTTKKDKSQHGYGLKGIETIANKYNGDLSLSCKDNIFCLSVIMSNKQ